MNRVEMVTTTFETEDIYTLANTLSPHQLRHEVAVTETQPDDGFPWVDFATACREALTWRPAKPPVTKPLSHGKLDVADLKARTDIVSLIGQYTRLRKTGNRFTGRCPLHSDKAPSLVVYPDSQSWHCFGACNTGGDAIAFIQAIEHTDFRGAIAILGGSR